MEGAVLTTYYEQKTMEEDRKFLGQSENGLGTLKEGMMVPGARDNDDDDDDSVASSVPELKSNISSNGHEAEEHEKKDKEVQEVKKNIQQETNFVTAMRLIVIITMLIVSAAVTYATYIFLDSEEHDEFESSVRTAAFLPLALLSCMPRLTASFGSCVINSTISLQRL